MLARMLTGATAACVLLGTSALATNGQSDVQAFEAAYFERFAPQTAEDMLRQVPGFSVRESGGGRGLGQGGTNVLINGERVTSKDTSALDILAQTPARSVVRIEVADAASLGVTGLTGQVANVVLDRSGLSGSWEWEPLFRHNAKPRLHRSAVSVAGEAGRLSYTLGVDHRSWRGTEEGVEQRLLADGTLVEERFEDRRLRFEAPTVTADLDYAIGKRTNFALTGSATIDGFEEREDSFGLADTRRSSTGKDEWRASVSSELRQEIGPGTARIIGFQSYRKKPFTARTINKAINAPIEEVAFLSEAISGESIGRGEYGWSRPGGVTWEFALESAFNFLEVENTLESDDGGGTVMRDVFPVTRVEEMRHQASLSRGFTWWNRLAVQASLAGEWSCLTVDAGTGTSALEESFLRPKGSVSLSYPLSARSDLRGRFERAVAQLDFEDFVDSVDLTEQRETAGNSGLVPQQSWIGELEFEQRFGNNEKIIVRAVSELIRDRVDRVLIDGEDAVGNIDQAIARTFETEGTLLTDRWNIAGGRLDFVYRRFSSELEDPIDGRTRGFNRARDWRYDISFRQDVPSTPYAWGVSAEHEDDFAVFRFNEIQHVSVAAPQYNAFFEHKDVLGMNLQLGVQNILNREFEQERIRFDGIRTDGAIDIIERRVRTENERFSIRLSGTF